ncbi:DUF1488 domain-containing protein [Burkholderia pseudomultivorans]|uniref:DUF1488 family protein n=1 Tax=Burkholderia pseudomultivorans TaxID=1207504 RepID=UPI002875499F|nr:DUF1488 family protein [Burkholderia pseudomultivorans]MDS0859406.1 DUF1488 domain-containing protein [Burkholderia pseudomultivorans]
MMKTIASITTPVVSDDFSLLFSAYGQGWGYIAFRLSADVICDKFGVSEASPELLLAAFERNRETIARVIGQRTPAGSGERIQLTRSDF